MVVRRLARELGWELTRDAALCLYVGLVTDTGRFQYPNTTPDVFHLAEELAEYDLPIARITRELFEKHRFQLAYSSEGKWFSHAESMRRYIMQFGPSGYWSQHYIWFGRNADVMIETINRGRDQRENAHH